MARAERCRLAGRNNHYGRPAKPKAGCRVAAKAEVRAGKATSRPAAAPAPGCGVPPRMPVYGVDRWRHGTHERLHRRSRPPLLPARRWSLPHTMREGESARSQILRFDQTARMFIDQGELYQRPKARLPDNVSMPYRSGGVDGDERRDCPSQQPVECVNRGNQIKPQQGESGE